LRVAGIYGTRIAVITREGLSALALAVNAGVRACADVAVRAGLSFSRYVLAASAGKAAIDRTRFFVVTCQATSPDTGASLTGVRGGACVEVVAFGLIGREGTSLECIAGVVGAWIAIFARERFDSALALAIAAYILEGAGVSVIAGQSVGLIDATCQRVAGVSRTRVIIVAFCCCLRGAGPVLAVRSVTAWITVIARGFVGCMDTSGIATSVAGAWVSIITGERSCSSLTATIVTRIAESAWTAVVTRDDVGCVETSGARFTCVIGTGVSIVADGGASWRAGAL
jgi:hypothetical protein